MKKCKVCEEEGKTATFKDGRGLSLHLRYKHNMNFQEYMDMYGIANTADVLETENEEPISKKEKDNEKSTNSRSSPTIRDFWCIEQQYAVVFEKEDIREVVGIGTIETNSRSLVSVLVLNDRGEVVPPEQISENYYLVNENLTKKLKKALTKSKRKKVPKQEKGLKQEVDQESAKRLIEELKKIRGDKT